MTSTKVLAVGAAGILIGFAATLTLPAFHVPGNIEVRFVGKYRGTGMLKSPTKRVNLTGDCKVKSTHVECVVVAGGPQI